MDVSTDEIIENDWLQATACSGNLLLRAVFAAAISQGMYICYVYCVSASCTVQGAGVKLFTFQPSPPRNSSVILIVQNATTETLAL